MAGRLPRHHFRGLLGIHSRYGLSTRCTAERYTCLEGSDGFVTSAAAPIASGWSDRVSRAGLAPAGMTLPFHGALYTCQLNKSYISINFMRSIVDPGSRERSLLSTN